MRIVVLDGFTLNPGDLSWDALKQLGACEFYDRTSPAELLSRLSGAEAALVNKVSLNRETIASLPDLTYIGVTATGYNIVDIEAARERAIPVCNVPAYGTFSVAQAAFALLLELTNRVGHHTRTVREGRWAASPDFCYWDYPLIELNGLTMGIVGFGRIGQEVARIARAFGMDILVHVRTPRPLPEGVRPASLEALLRQSDVVSLHCPLTSESQGLINAERLALMKPSAFLLNTSRGALIVEEDLARALREGKLAGAGLDVLSVEPPDRDNPLYSAPNCCITPHIAWATRAARQRLMNATVENLRAFQAGRPQNVVNPW